MSGEAWPATIGIESSEWSLDENIGISESIFTRRTQKISLSAGTADRWSGTVKTPLLTETEVRTMMAFLIRVGKYGLFELGHPDYTGPDSGASDGTVNGASQTGTTLNCNFAETSQTVLLAGEWLQFGDELKMCTADAVTDGSGDVAIAIRPAIRTSPADAAAVEINTPVATLQLLTDPGTDYGQPQDGCIQSRFSGVRMSERGFAAGLESELDADNPELAFLLELAFTGGTERLWSGIGDLSWNSQTWTGVGELGGFDKVAESLDKQDIGITFVLNYLDDDIRNELTTTDSTGNDASLYLGKVVASTRVASDVYELFPGFIDSVEIIDNGDSGEVRVRVASESAKLERPQSVSLTNAHQQYLFPGDQGLEFAGRMDEPVLWGRKPLEPSNRYVPSVPGYDDLSPGRDWY